MSAWLCQTLAFALATNHEVIAIENLALAFMVLNLIRGRWEEPISTPEYLVHDLMPTETVRSFLAKGSSLKTWAALSIGADIANGTPWLGVFTTKNAR